MSKKISVIIPVKNRASLLPITLNNILNQSLPPYEVIVVDDNSTDNINDVIEKYKDKVQFLKNKGKGAGAARNCGFEASTGDLIQFFDSDDLMTKNKLEIQSIELSKKNVGMVYSPHVKAYQDENNKWIQLDSILYYYPLPDTLKFDQLLIRGACMITQACLFDKNIFKETGLWRTDLMPHDDLELLFRIGKVVPYPIHTNKAGVIYRQHGAQITDQLTGNTAKILDSIRAWTYIKENMNEGYSNKDFLIIDTHIYHSLKCLEKLGIKIDDKKKNLFLYFTNLLFKITNKTGRIITNSEWQPLHGISNSEAIFESFIQNLS